jgi:hypothetical protein
MTKSGEPASHPTKSASNRKPDVVRLESAGQWIAWSTDGLRIVAVGPTQRACAAAVPPEHAGQVGVYKVPPRRRRLTGPDA